LRKESYKIITFPTVLYECETWSLTLKKEQAERVFENRVLRRIFGPKKDEVTGECRKLHNQEPLNLYSSPITIGMIKSRRMRWARHLARMREKRNAYRPLVGNPAGRLRRRPRHEWVDNIKMDLEDTRWDDVDWIGLAQDKDK
jgi:hypothetical protein